jgi:Flp pilus assembly protein TadG
MVVRVPTVARRSGTAAVELAIIFNLVMVPTLIGVLEVGRLVQVQQIVANSAREGARLAAQATTLSPSGTRTNIQTSSGSPNVKGTVFQYLVGAGLTQLSSSDVTVTFAYTDGSASTEPYQGTKLQPFRVTVTVTAYDKLKWINLGFITSNSVSYSVDWRILLDDPFVLNTTIPTW